MRLVYTCVIPVRWGDLDAFGHVNNTLYFRYIEQARISWLETLGFIMATNLPDGRVNSIPVVARLECDFCMPISAPALLEVSVSVGRPGRTSLETFHEIRLQTDGSLCAKARAILVWASGQDGRPLPLPSVVRELCDNIDGKCL
ncbi:TPA: acyl-CoA thioesterase [Pseudomonas aeruginosa]